MQEVCACVSGFIKRTLAVHGVKRGRHASEHIQASKISLTLGSNEEGGSGGRASSSLESLVGIWDLTLAENECHHFLGAKKIIKNAQKVRKVHKSFLKMSNNSQFLV